MFERFEESFSPSSFLGTFWDKYFALKHVYLTFTFFPYKHDFLIEDYAKVNMLHIVEFVFYEL